VAIISCLFSILNDDKDESLKNIKWRNMSNKFLNKITFFLLFSIVILTAAQNSSAAVWTVTKTADTNDSVCNADCSLREAVKIAQDNDEINFQPNLTELTIKLLSPISITKSITINGNGLKISGSDKVKIFSITGSASVKIADLDLGNAYVDSTPAPLTGAGGAIYINNASLELEDCYVHNSGAYSVGGGIAVIGGVLSIKNSRIAANKAATAGGGIYAHYSQVSISNSKFNLNHTSGNNSAGGALFLTDSSLEMTDSSVYKNSSPTGFGGGLFISGNMNEAVCTIRDSAVHNNSAKNGGGIYNNGKMNLINSTLSGNHAGISGGGLTSHNYTAFLRNVTVTMNSAAVGAGGIDSIDGEVNFGNTIVAGNNSGNLYSTNMTGVFTSAGYNLIGPSVNATVLGTQTGNQINVVDPILNPLNYNGSATLNHLPKPGSPVIDAGSNLLAVDESGNPLLFDQRGLNRISGGAVDIGAVEVPN
jgi:CSLREA domain-containing protein